MNLLVSQFLDFAEFQAMEQNARTMRDWIDARQIVANRRKLLQGSGSLSRKETMAKAEKEFEICRKREMALYESDFEK